MTQAAGTQGRGVLAWMVVAAILVVVQSGLFLREGGLHARAVEAAKSISDKESSSATHHVVAVDSNPSGATVQMVVSKGDAVSLGTTPLVARVPKDAPGRVHLVFHRPGYSGQWEVPSAMGGRGGLVQSTPLAPTIPILSPMLFVYPWGTAAMVALGVAAWMKKRAVRLAVDLQEATEEVSYMEEGGRIGEYRLLRLLGEGGMAEVFLGQAGAREPGNRSPLVAVKVMREELCNDDDFRKRIQREVAIARSLDHPSIVRLLGSGDDRGRLYMVMEYVKGSNLRERMDANGSSPMSPREAVSLLLPVVSALSYSHGKGVVHRDLKPENILLTEAGLPKVTDFGMARANESETLTATGMFLGTPSYMAPEQVSNPRTTPRADIYSLGCILYEMLAGRLPFTGSFEELVMKRLTEDPPPLRTFCATVPEPLERFVMRMVHPDPDERPASCDEVSEGLVALLPRLPAGR